MYREKYAIILLSMVLVGLWQTFYLFLKTTLDRSMIGYGFFGLLVYFFSLHYRPLRLLDRMLSNIASEMPEAMFVYAAFEYKRSAENLYNLPTFCRHA